MIVVLALADTAFAYAAVRIGSDGRPSVPTAVPLHPIAGSFVPDGTRLSDCANLSCFQQALGNVAYREGPTEALSLVADIYGDRATSECHSVVHTIGSAALARYHGNVARTFAKGSPACWSGYYHGVLERSLVNVRSYEASSLASVARPLCKTSRTSMTPWIAYQCVHGLGHGLMVATGLNLPLSLDVCKRLRTRWDRDGCKGGVFMENLSSSKGFRSNWLRDDDPLYPCTRVAREDKRRCYLMVTSRILPAVGGDWERTAAICSRVESDFVHTCFQSLGRDASSRSNRNPDQIVRTCAVARPYRGEGECIATAAMDIASNFASGVRARALCDVVAPALLSDCYFGIGAVVGRFRTSEAARVADCRAIAPEHRLVASCLAGGRSTLPHR